MAFTKYGDTAVVRVIEDDSYCDKCLRKMRKVNGKYVCDCEKEKEPPVDEY